MPLGKRTEYAGAPAQPNIRQSRKSHHPWFIPLLCRRDSQAAKARRPLGSVLSFPPEGSTALRARAALGAQKHWLRAAVHSLGRRPPDRGCSPAMYTAQKSALCRSEMGAVILPNPSHHGYGGFLPLSDGKSDAYVCSHTLLRLLHQQLSDDTFFL